MSYKSNARSEKEIEKLIEQEAQHLEDEIRNLHFEYFLDKYENEYKPAKPISFAELSEDEQKAFAQGQAQVGRQLEWKQRCARIRSFLQIGIRGKSGDPDSELFRTAKELQDIVDRCESEPSLVSSYEQNKFGTGMSRYKELLKAESKRTPQITLPEQKAGREIAHAEAEKAGVNIHISGGIQAENVQIANRASIRQELRTQNEATKRTMWERICRLVKKVPRWIYGLIIFLAALLPVLYYFDLLERIKAFFGTILR